jgi:hypothetical protein
MMTVDDTKSRPLTREEEEVLRALRGISFGSVEVILHASKIVEIVRKEKFRTDRTTGGSQRNPR